MKFQNYESDNDADISNMFADFFSSTYSTKKYDNPNYNYNIRYHQIVNIPKIDCTELEHELKSLKHKITHGSDGIPDNYFQPFT